MSRTATVVTAAMAVLITAASLPADAQPQGGFAPLFAEIRVDGTVSPHVPSNGITNDNVVMVNTGPTETEPGDISYCFSGLPPISGGQITISDTKENGENGQVVGYLALQTGDPDCSPRVHIVTEGGFTAAAGYHILLIAAF